MLAQDASEQAGASAAVDRFEAAQVEAQEVGLVAGPFDLAAVAEVGQVEDGAGGGRDGDGVFGGDVLGRERRAVDDDGAPADAGSRRLGP